VAEQQNILIKILADVAGANASFGKLQKTLADLSGGTIALSKNFNAFKQGVSGSIGAQKAAEQVSKQYLQTMRERLNISRAEVAGIKAITEMHRAEAAAINAKLALQKAELAGDQVILKEMQQELQLRKLSIQEIELENRARRALAASQKASTKATTESTDAVRGLSAGTGSASFALLSLGQAFQDSAQFGMGFAQGFRAINNNIQQTFTAIALGSVQMGGFKNLMSAMAGSLWGPGGLILGFSAISAAVEFFATRAQRAKKDAEELSKSFDGLFSSIQVGSIESTIAGEESALRMIELYLQQKQTGDEFLETVRSQGILNAQNRKGFEESAEAIDRHNDAIRLNIESRKDDIEAAKEQNKILYESIQALGIDGIIRALRSGREEWEKTNGIVERAQMIFSAGFGTEAEFNKGFEAFSQSLSGINPKIKITEEEFAKLSEKGGLDKFLADEQWKVTVKNLDAIKKESEEIAKAWEKILGVDQRMTIADRAKKLEVPDKLATPEGVRVGIDEYKKYIDATNEVIDQNQAIRESMAQVATDLAVSFATMGGGFDAFMKTMGRFLTKYGAEMVKHGMLTAALGVSIEAVKDALSKFQGKKAIIAGLALVAIGTRLRANARSASDRLQGGSGSASTPNFTMPNPLTSPASFSSQGMFPATSNAPSFSGRFVASGRDLVAVVGAEISAQQEIGIRNPLSIRG
jgi:hypothetical protein